MLRRSDHGSLLRPENTYIEASSRQPAKPPIEASSQHVRHSKKSARRTLDPASTFSGDLNNLESRANGQFLVRALTCDDTCGVEFEGAGDRSAGRWLDEVGLDGLGVRLGQVPDAVWCWLLWSIMVSKTGALVIV